MVDSPIERSLSRSALSGENIRSQIETVLAERVEQGRIDDFIHLCHRLAVAYLKVKTAAGRFDARRFGVTVEDFGFDAIGDLFRRDESGRFVEWRAYFSKLDTIPVLNDDELFVAVRRVVLSSVNNRIFRVFGEFEPAQARISRNIKLALKRHPRLVLKDARGEQVVMLCNTSRNTAAYPEIAPETIDAWFTGRVTAASSLSEILDCIVALFSHRPVYRSAIRFLSLVKSVSNVYGREYSHEMSTSEGPSVG